MQGSGRILGFLSYVAVAAVGIALFVAALISKNSAAGAKAVDILSKIAYYSALASIGLGSLVFCFSQKKLLLWIVWLVAATLLVLGAFVL